MSKKQRNEEVLIQNVKNNPNNLAAAFRLTARQTKRSFNAVQGHYYCGHVLKSGEKRGVSHRIPMFITQTVNGMLLNTKNSSVIKENSKVLKLKANVSNLAGLNTEEKVALFDIIFK
jgi:hypothetical protein